MSWLISKIVSNPLVLIAIILAAVAFGGSTAWFIQGLRIEAAKNATQKVKQDFVDYQQTQRETFLKLEEKRRAQAIESSKQLESQQKDLEKANAEGETLRRCIAAGKCDGMRVKSCVPSAPSKRIQTDTRVDDSGSDAISVIGGVTPQVVTDCSIETLRFNRLQEAIENQPGY